ncbi:MAG TPA: multicopper oxidase domain-containing protein [Vicinamibacterales bacterium]
MTRRSFIRQATAATAGATLALPRCADAFQHQVMKRVKSAMSLRADSLAKFVDPLPIPARAAPTGVRATDGSKAPCYGAVMQAVERRVHRDLPPTRFWSFGPTFPGPTFEVCRGQGIWIDWINRLPARHFLPIDHTIHGAEPHLPQGRAVVHVHGAKVAPEHDGYPERWFDTGSSASYYYPNDQDAATLWYHDHTMGINRLNVYAGLMGLYIIRDAAEDRLNLPAGRYDVPLLICDRLLRTDGQLDYPTSGKPDAPWVDDATGDAILINGAVFPYLDVEPRKYRFRIVNGSNGRFLRLGLADGPPIHQIATDQGLMAAPVEADRIRLAPAERADVVIDFAACRGTSIVVENDGMPVMQFRVSPTAVDETSELPSQLRSIDWLTEHDAVQSRVHTLSEDDDLLARPMRMLLNRTRWQMPVTERPQIDTTEIWSFANVTDESHPIHLHLARFQVLDRRNFDLFNYQTAGRIVFTGPPRPRDRTEEGWKDTVRADAAMITRIAVRFEGFTGRYMWHCHVLEHGDNEMMRPFDVVKA